MKSAKDKIFRLIPYSIFAIFLTALMFFGSKPPAENNTFAQVALTSLDDRSIVPTADQVSESYIVADLANSVSMPSSFSNSANYISVAAKYKIFGSSGDSVNSDTAILDKPTIIDSESLSRGIIFHIVKEGDSLASIIRQYRSPVSKDQLRWSNALKTEELTVGSTLLVPSIAGVVYRVSEGDTSESLAQRFASNANDIIKYNDLQDGALTPGMTITIPRGVMPMPERPEYTRPTTSPRRFASTYGDGTRMNMHEIANYGAWRGTYYATLNEGNRNGFGQCTWYAWWWRRHNMPSNYWLPAEAIGNANVWYYRLSGKGYRVGKTPQYGAIFQNTSGRYGHVGVVTGVSPGNSITIREMNYAGPNGKLNHVYESTIAWSDVYKFNYIYGK